ncbi:MAG: GH92 family glycosyl hydrolase [Prevotellaceae bacterium]|jgi:predicted alpha-1,2-mannosidase|nr:GH92 family glycosyl hydrolase [Prevotellaceae bacterium]
MNRIIPLLLCILAFGCGSRQTAPQERISDYVDPFIGATTVGYEAGKTFPGAASPFGMVQLNPNTVTGGDNGSGYSYENTTIEGFAMTQMSGIGWFGDLGNFLTMPTTGELKVVAGKQEQPEAGYRSRYDKATETAKPGYYSVNLTDYGIRTEAIATPHAGMLRFTYPESKTSRIQIDLARRVAGASAWQTVRVIDDHTITGRMECTPNEGGWGNGGGKALYTVYYYTQFSRPLKNSGVWSADIPDGQERRLDDVVSDAYRQIVEKAKIIRNVKEYEGKHLGFFTEFETSADEQVLMKTGISFVSEEGARKNLEADIPHWDFDKVREQTRTLWDKALGRITVTGGTDEQRTIFYTALYHTMIDPRMFSDVDGKYIGGDRKIHSTGSFNKRTIFSGWDVFRSQMPLLTIISPDVVNDLINSLVTLADESGKGYLERWEFLNAYSGCMVGNPAISVIVDAYMKGIRSFDVDEAYKYAALTTEKFGNGERGFTPDNPLWKGGISTTLEHAYTEWCMAEFARALGKSGDYSMYIKRSQSYRNLWDNKAHWFRAKNEKGDFIPETKLGRLHENYGAVESNPYQQGWFVPHDVNGLAELMGGREAAIADLDTMFINTPANFLWNNYYNHSNEPVHHIPFLYNRLGEPWKTQYWSRFVCTHAYKTGVNGLIGNEDVGQMSAWYVLAASGIHPVCPGETRYELASPLFDRIVWNLTNGKTFTVNVSNNSAENVYIQSATLNGQTYNRCYIDHADIVNGGTLELVMGDSPNTKWGVE